MSLFRIKGGLTIIIIISLLLITETAKSCIHSETMAGRDNTEHSKWFVEIQKK